MWAGVDALMHSLTKVFIPFCYISTTTFPEFYLVRETNSYKVE